MLNNYKFLQTYNGFRHPDHRDQIEKISPGDYVMQMISFKLYYLSSKISAFVESSYIRTSLGYSFPRSKIRQAIQERTIELFEYIRK